MFGLLKHENKMSILNLILKRTPSNNSTIMSKERLIFHIGARRFTACPIFSQHTNGDKHKVYEKKYNNYLNNKIYSSFQFERTMPENDTFVATIYAPITFMPASVLVYKQLENGIYSFV
jgi:pre-rRNA-processing protein TSR1